MRVRLRIGEKEDLQLPGNPAADLLFEQVFIPRYSPVEQYALPLTIYCICALLHCQGGREFWQKYRHHPGDTLAAEVRQDTERAARVNDFETAGMGI